MPTSEKKVFADAAGVSRTTKKTSKRGAGGGGHGSTVDHDTDNTTVGGGDHRSNVDRGSESQYHASHTHGPHSIQSLPVGARREIIVYENTFRMEPQSRFDAELVEKLISNVLSTSLEKVMYDPAHCKQLCQELATQMTERLKELHWRRYKYVALVSIGSHGQKPSMNVGSRCLWNLSTDSYATTRFTNGSIYAVAMVYGLYFE